MLTIKIFFLFCLVAVFTLLHGCSLTTTAKQDESQPFCVPPPDQQANGKQAKKNIADGLDNEGDALLLSGNYEKAVSCYNQALGIRELAFGKSSSAVIESLNNLATLREAKGEYSDALKLYRRTLKILKHQPNPKLVRMTLGYIAAIRYQGSKNDTLANTQRNLIAYQQIYGINNIYYGVTQHRLANFYLIEKNFPESKKAFKAAMAIIQQTTGPGHPYYARVLMDYAELLRLTNRKPLADRMEQTAHSILEKYPKKRLSEIYQAHRAPPL